MPHSAAALAQVMHLTMSAKKDFKELHDLGGLLRLSPAELARALAPQGARASLTKTAQP